MNSVVPPKNTFVTSAAVVSVLEDGVRICYLDKVDKVRKNADGSPLITNVVTFSDGQKCKIYGFDQLPVQFSPEDSGAETVFRVKSEGSDIIEFLPENEEGLEGRFVDFYRTNGVGTDPIPALAKKWNKDDPYEANVLQFCARFKIEGGSFDGKFVDGYFQFHKSGISKKEGHRPYEFVTFPKDTKGDVGIGFDVQPSGLTGQVWSDLVWGLLKYGGVIEGASIPFPEDGNPLPQIENKLQQANKLLKLNIHNGRVKEISSAKKLTVSIAKPAQTIERGIEPNTDTDPEIM